MYSCQFRQLNAGGASVFPANLRVDGKHSGFAEVVGLIHGVEVVVMVKDVVKLVDMEVITGGAIVMDVLYQWTRDVEFLVYHLREREH